MYRKWTSGAIICLVFCVIFVFAGFMCMMYEVPLYALCFLVGGLVSAVVCGILQIVDEIRHIDKKLK
jgi:hypothetical protein